MPVKQGQEGVHQEMKKFSEGELHSGSGHKVKKRKQAIAIALKEAGMSYYGKGRSTHGS